MILDEVLGWTFERSAATETITAGSRPQATCTHSNWSLLPTVVHRRGLWKLPQHETTTPAREHADKGPA